MSSVHTTSGMEGYRQVHRLTPLLRVWTFTLALATIALFLSLIHISEPTRPY